MGLATALPIKEEKRFELEHFIKRQNNEFCTFFTASPSYQVIRRGKDFGRFITTLINFNFEKLSL